MIRSRSLATEAVCFLVSRKSNRPMYLPSEDLAEEALLLGLCEAHRAGVAQQARHGVVVGLRGIGLGVQDDRLALVGRVEHVARLRNHADALEAEDLLDVADAQ